MKGNWTNGLSDGLAASWFEPRMWRPKWPLSAGSASEAVPSHKGSAMGLMRSGHVWGNLSALPSWLALHLPSTQASLGRARGMHELRGTEDVVAHPRDVRKASSGCRAR